MPTTRQGSYYPESKDTPIKAFRCSSCNLFVTPLDPRRARRLHQKLGYYLCLHCEAKRTENSDKAYLAD